MSRIITFFRSLVAEHPASPMDSNYPLGAIFGKICAVRAASGKVGRVCGSHIATVGQFDTDGLHPGLTSSRYHHESARKMKLPFQLEIVLLLV